jgi:hypothetical protein
MNTIEKFENRIFCLEDKLERQVSILNNEDLSEKSKRVLRDKILYTEELILQTTEDLIQHLEKLIKEQ